MPLRGRYTCSVPKMNRPHVLTCALSAREKELLALLRLVLNASSQSEVIRRAIWELADQLNVELAETDLDA